ncbi:MAG: hypothetical protein ACR2HS_03160, partial [Gammaproteobacteria bacterium]
PGDLRSKEAILSFVRINLIRYGSVCDFYLPKKYMQDPEVLKEVEDICKEHQVEYDYVTPDTTKKSEILNSSKSKVRFFSGFDLSDDLYKGLYLYNKKAGAGISGDDGISLAISGGNLPFHGKTLPEEGIQSVVIKDMMELAKELGLNNLGMYFQFFFERKKNDNYIELENHLNSEQLKLILQEYDQFVAYIHKKKDIFYALIQQFYYVNKYII